MLNSIRKNWLVVLLIVVAFVCYTLTIVPSGQRYCFDGICGMYFWGAHGHDAIWHLAIVATSFSQFPFIMPTFAGATLGGYNYFLDLVIFGVSKIGISPLISYFKIIPIVWFGLFTFLLIKLSRKINKSSIFLFIYLLFVYFSGSFSYLITYIREKTIWGSSGVLIMQPLLSLTNVQFALSILILTLIMVIIKDDRQSIRSLMLLGFLVAVNLALKFYGGVISLFVVSMYFVMMLIRTKKIGNLLYGFLAMLVSVGVVLFVLYKPDSQTIAGSPLSWSPLSTVYPLIEDPNLLFKRDLVNARYFLEDSGKFSPRLILINLYIAGLFLVMNFGTRILGLFYVLYRIWKKKISQFEALMLLTVIFSMFLCMFFVQKGIWWNTVQFSYYAFFLSNLFVAEMLYVFIKKNRVFGILVLLIVFVFTIPNSIDVVRSFSQQPGHTYLADDEIKALSFLKKQQNGVVYSPLPTANNQAITKQTPLYALGDNAYITAFSGKQSYIADEVQLELISVNYKKREAQSRDWNCLTVNRVDYLYEIKNNPMSNKLDKCKDKIVQIYKNDAVTIYKVNR